MILPLKSLALSSSSCILRADVELQTATLNLEEQRTSLITSLPCAFLWMITIV